MLLAAGFSGKGRDIPRAIPVFADSIGMENRAIAAMARRQRLTAITVGEKAIRGKPNNAR
ncbi:MAG TPA: hypothetical protein DEP05_09795 [Betaproteobacteria bacterium]|nr:hypothetical protein [Betaproteobacteria bacterium]